MNRVTLFTRPSCEICRSVRYVIERVRADLPFDLDTVDISSPGNERWLEAYRGCIPVVHLNGKEAFRGGIDERRLRQLLRN